MDKTDTSPQPAVGERIDRSVSFNVRQNDSDKIVFEISNAQLDRHGTVIDPEGMDLSAFQRNPVVLFGHGFETPMPIGRSPNIFKRGDSIYAEVEFDPEDERALQIESKVRRGFLNAASVGIVPKEIDRSGEEPRISKSELMEFSIVPVPSNSGALVVQRSAVDELRQEIEQLRAELNDAKLQAAERSAEPVAEESAPEADDSAAEEAERKAAMSDGPRPIQMRLSDVQALMQRASRTRKTKARQLAKQQLGKA